jgi:hypothetical protein
MYLEGLRLLSVRCEVPCLTFCGRFDSRLPPQNLKHLRYLQIHFATIAKRADVHIGLCPDQAEATNILLAYLHFVSEAAGKLFEQLGRSACQSVQER